MLLDIVHETRYEYAPAVKTARHVAHLKPAHGTRQQLLSHEVVMDPPPGQRSEAVDVWGNTRTCFSYLAQHDELKVVAHSVVATSPSPAVLNDMSWQEARERMRYHRGASYDAAAEFVFASPYVPRHSDFVEYALPSFAAGRPLTEAARDLMARINADFDYESQATDVSTPALEALHLRKGVCQDFAHVMLSCLRSLGLAARYVSGYLLTEPPPGQAKLVGSDASHAWVSIYVPGPDDARGDWLDLDPTNRRAPGEDYVVLATGRDYSDVSPVRGVIHGGGNHLLHVAVTVSPAAAPTIAP
ncbi:MAG TPA: transglutaminase family protein [Ramlibacter sp.]|nr:transglutaminase family protein [Ramlibacter sp.]